MGKLLSRKMIFSKDRLALHEFFSHILFMAAINLIGLLYVGKVAAVSQKVRNGEVFSVTYICTLCHL